MYKEIEIPFSNRHTCWFCGEPSIDELYKFPAKQSDVNSIEHEALLLPICNECNSYKSNKYFTSIFVLRDFIKGIIVEKYSKALGIGLNWTEQELVTSELEGYAFEGFKKSAWPMFEIAKSKINFHGWPIIVDDVPLDFYSPINSFVYEGIQYKNIDNASNVIIKELNLDRILFEESLDIVGESRFEYVVKLCKLNTSLSSQARNQILNDLFDEEEQKEIDAENENNRNNLVKHNIPLSDIVERYVEKKLIPSKTLKWIFDREIETLAELHLYEDEFFDDFAHEGGVRAFEFYNAAQIYLNSK
jgi:hypothetical protein